MDVLALILTCSLHSDDALVRVMVDVQSGGNPYFVGDLATLKTNDNLTSADEALRVAADIARQGGRPAVGLLGVPLDWAARFGRSPPDLFDGCTNLAIGTAMFAEFQNACSPQEPHRRSSPVEAHRSARASAHSRPVADVRTCVLTRLARALGLHGTPAEILKRMDVRPKPEGAETPPRESSIFGAGADDPQELPPEWSDARIYFIADDGVGESAPAAAPRLRRAQSSPLPTPQVPPSPSRAAQVPRPAPHVPIVPPAPGATTVQQGFSWSHRTQPKETPR